LVRELPEEKQERPMSRALFRVIVLIIALSVVQTAMGQSLQDSPRPVKAASDSTPQGVQTPKDPIVFGHPMSFWIQILRERNPETFDLAVDAIVQLGPDAKTAVPDLVQILNEPFAPIKFGVDTRDESRAKLLEIHYKAGAVDGLGAIGEAAASAAEPVIRWGLTTRVVASDDRPRATDGLLIGLIGVDVLERMRAAGAVARFGKKAAGPVQALIESDDNERRKFAAAIMSDETVVVATDLMKSNDCRNRKLGLSLLSAMWPVVAKEHLETLLEIVDCSENKTQNPPPSDDRESNLLKISH
jgi:hypothetical protein